MSWMLLTSTSGGRGLQESSEASRPFGATWGSDRGRPCPSSLTTRPWHRGGPGRGGGGGARRQGKLWRRGEPRWQAVCGGHQGRRERHRRGRGQRARPAQEQGRLLPCTSLGRGRGHGGGREPRSSIRRSARDARARALPLPPSPKKKETVAVAAANARGAPDDGSHAYFGRPAQE